MSDHKKVFKYPGSDLDVTWDSRLCIHVGECTRDSAKLFVSGRNPWCQPDDGSAEQLLHVVRACPTGALACHNKDGTLAETATSSCTGSGAGTGTGTGTGTGNQVVVANNGPLYFSGELQIDGSAEDMPSTKFRAALCRCGKSNNKPFCDNQHESDGFRDRGAIGESGEELDEATGALQVKRAPNGPLLLSGPCRLVTGAGRVAWSGTKAALCRCGESKNKPFCDGAHKAAGFQAD